VQLHGPLVGIELLSTGKAGIDLPLRRDFEYGVLVLEGAVAFCGERAVPGELLYLPPGHDTARLTTDAASRTLLIGGTPFTEPLLMWWNFIGRSKAEIEQYTRDWNAGAEAFGEVRGYPGARLTAPPPPWMQD
jgi:quercetin 2,3-dioxygenase